MRDWDGRYAAEAVLGAAFADERAKVIALSRLTAEMFYLDQHRLLFATLKDLHDEGEPADLVTVTRHLHTQGMLERVGGAVEVSALLDRTPDVGNVESYCRIVEEDWARRQAISATRRLLSEIEAGKPIEPALREHGADLAEALEVQGPARVVFGEGVWDDLRREIPKGRKLGIPGIDELGGVLPGMVVLAARPGVGKSTYLAQATVEAIQKGLRTLVVSAEMPRWKWAGWMLSSLSGQPYRDLPWPPEERWKDVLGSPYFGFYWRHGLVDADDLCAAIRESNPEVVILDHISKLYLKRSRSDTRALELQRALDMLHGLALEKEFVILAAAHLNRDIEKRAGGRPQFSDLREAGAIENCADMVVYLYPAKGEDLRDEIVEMEFDCDKNRFNGDMATVPLRFDRPTRTFLLSVAPRPSNGNGNGKYRWGVQ